MLNFNFFFFSNAVKQDRMLEKHIKLDYEVISPCPNDALQRWETVLTSPEVDYSTLECTVKYGM